MEPSGNARNFREFDRGVDQKSKNNPMHSRDVIDNKWIFLDADRARTRWRKATDAVSLDRKVESPARGDRDC